MTVKNTSVSNQGDLNSNNCLSVNRYLHDKDILSLSGFNRTSKNTLMIKEDKSDIKPLSSQEHLKRRAEVEYDDALQCYYPKNNSKLSEEGYVIQYINANGSPTEVSARQSDNKPVCGDRKGKIENDKLIITTAESETSPKKQKPISHSHNRHKYKHHRSRYKNSKEREFRSLRGKEITLHDKKLLPDSDDYHLLNKGKDDLTLHFKRTLCKEKRKIDHEKISNAENTKTKIISPHTRSFDETLAEATKKLYDTIKAKRKSKRQQSPKSSIDTTTSRSSGNKTDVQYQLRLERRKYDKAPTDFKTQELIDIRSVEKGEKITTPLPLTESTQQNKSSCRKEQFPAGIYQKPLVMLKRLEQHLDYPDVQQLNAQGSLNVLSVELRKQTHKDRTLKSRGHHNIAVEQENGHIQELVLSPPNSELASKFLKECINIRRNGGTKQCLPIIETQGISSDMKTAHHSPKPSHHHPDNTIHSPIHNSNPQDYYQKTFECSREAVKPLHIEPVESIYLKPALNSIPLAINDKCSIIPSGDSLKGEHLLFATGNKQHEADFNVTARSQWQSSSSFCDNSGKSAVKVCPQDPINNDSLEKYDVIDYNQSVNFHQQKHKYTESVIQANRSEDSKVLQDDVNSNFNPRFSDSVSFKVNENVLAYSTKVILSHESTEVSSSLIQGEWTATAEKETVQMKKIHESHDKKIFVKAKHALGEPPKIESKNRISRHRKGFGFYDESVPVFLDHHETLDSNKTDESKEHVQNRERYARVMVNIPHEAYKNDIVSEVKKTFKTFLALEKAELDEENKNSKASNIISSTSTSASTTSLLLSERGCNDGLDNHPLQENTLVAGDRFKKSEIQEQLRKNPKVKVDSGDIHALKQRYLTDYSKFEISNDLAHSKYSKRAQYTKPRNFNGKGNRFRSLSLDSALSISKVAASSNHLQSVSSLPELRYMSVPDTLQASCPFSFQKRGPSFLSSALEGHEEVSGSQISRNDRGVPNVFKHYSEVPYSKLHIPNKKSIDEETESGENNGAKRPTYIKSFGHKKRKKEKRKGSGDEGVQNITDLPNKQRQVSDEEERGRRLAREFPRFNWLEEKILNTPCVSTSMTPSSQSSESTTPSSFSASSKALLCSSQNMTKISQKSSQQKSTANDSIKSEAKPLPALIPNCVFNEPRVQSLPPQQHRSPTERQPTTTTDATDGGRPTTELLREKPLIKNSSDSVAELNTVLRMKRCHLQTAVPPLTPTQKVTALPKPKITAVSTPSQTAASICNGTTQYSSISSTHNNEKDSKLDDTIQNGKQQLQKSSCSDKNGASKSTEIDEQVEKSSDNPKLENQTTHIPVTQKLSILTEAFKSKLNTLKDSEEQTSHEEVSVGVKEDLTVVTENVSKNGIAPSKNEIVNEINSSDHDDQSKITSSFAAEEETPVLISIPEGAPSIESVLCGIKMNEPLRQDLFGFEKKEGGSSLIAALYDELMKTRQEVEKLRKVQEEMLNAEKATKSASNCIVDLSKVKKEEGTTNSNPLLIDIADSEHLQGTREEIDRDTFQQMKEGELKFVYNIKENREKRAISEEVIEPMKKRFKESPNNDDVKTITIRYTLPGDGGNQRVYSSLESESNNDKLRNMLGIYNNDLDVVPVKDKRLIRTEGVCANKTAEIEKEELTISSTKGGQLEVDLNSKSDRPELYKLLSSNWRHDRASLPELPNLIPSTPPTLSLRRYSDPNEERATVSLSRIAHAEPGSSLRPILQEALTDPGKLPFSTYGIHKALKPITSIPNKVPEPQLLDYHHQVPILKQSQPPYPAMTRHPMHPKYRDQEGRKMQYQNAVLEAKDMEGRSEQTKDTPSLQMFHPRVLTPNVRKPPPSEWIPAMQPRLYDQRMPLNPPIQRVAHHSVAMPQVSPRPSNIRNSNYPPNSNMAEIIPVPKGLPPNSHAIQDQKSHSQLIYSMPSRLSHITNEFGTTNQGHFQSQHSRMSHYPQRPPLPYKIQSSHQVPVISVPNIPPGSISLPPQYSSNSCTETSQKNVYTRKMSNIFPHQKVYLRHQAPIPTHQISPTQQRNSLQQNVNHEAYPQTSHQQVLVSSQGPHTIHYAPQPTMKSPPSFEQPPPPYPTSQNSPQPSHKSPHVIKSSTRPSSYPPAYKSLPASILSTNDHQSANYEHRIQRFPNENSSISSESQGSPPTQSPSKSAHACFVCSQRARFICSGCSGAWYCSKECQRRHWPEHSPDCQNTRTE